MPPLQAVEAGGDRVSHPDRVRHRAADTGEAAGMASAPIRIGPTQGSEEGTAAGIYGIIVSAAVMVASHGRIAAAIVLSVVVTLVIYWAAERYARIVAERIHEGHRPSRHTLRVQLTSGWEMITASTLPVAVLVVVRVLGADLHAAVLWALTCSTGLLCWAGWRVGRDGRLTPVERLVSTAVAGVFGAGLVLLKTSLHSCLEVRAATRSSR
jgi:hypothetical protein